MRGLLAVFFEGYHVTIVWGIKESWLMRCPFNLPASKGDAFYCAYGEMG